VEGVRLETDSAYRDDPDCLEGTSRKGNVIERCAPSAYICLKRKPATVQAALAAGRKREVE
jgi:hypothetical protein